MLLDSAAHCLGAVLTNAPAIGDPPSPLEDALLALVVLRQDSCLEAGETEDWGLEEPRYLDAWIHGCLEGWIKPFLHPVQARGWL